MHRTPIEPGMTSDIGLISPRGGSLGKGVDRILGTHSSDISNIRSLLNDLLSRVKRLEEEVGNLWLEVGDLRRDLNKSKETITATDTTLKKHYHSELVYPGTVTTAIFIDSEGSVVCRDGWTFEFDPTFKVTQHDVDKGLEL